MEQPDPDNSTPGEATEGGEQSDRTPDDEESPAYEKMLPEDLPVLQEELGEVAESESTEVRRGENKQLAKRLLERPLPSAMWRSLGKVLRFLANLLFAHVLFETRCLEDIRDADKRGTVVYAMQSRSRLDYLYFNYAFLKHELPLAQFANGVSLRPIRWLLTAMGRLLKPGPTPREQQMEALVDQGESAFLFLQRPRQSKEEALEYSQSYLYRLIQLQRRRQEPIFVMPLLLVWEKRPDPRRAGIVDEIFGTVQSPGFFRKLLHYVQTVWQSFLRFGQPMVEVSTAINLQNFLREYPDADSSDASELLRARLEDFIRRERKVILGPTALPKREIQQEVLDRPELVSTVQQLAESRGVDEAQVRREAQKQLEEIAAKPSLLTLKIFSSLLSFVWYRIYDGFEIDEEGLEKVREAARSSSIVLVPSHKSHIDYLVLSYVVYHYGMMTPHIAAGKNLLIPLVGALFRRAGAFFIRRSFRGEELYPVVFREYLIRLMEEGYPIEFFIEGTRSRTGKAVKPKYGMLDMIVEAYASGRLDSVKIVPISVGYEKIIEERSFRKELLGAEKEPESLTDLLKTPKFLVSKKGRLYIEFDEPIDLEEYFERYRIDRLHPDEEQLDALTVRLAHRIIYDINQITTVSPTALVATVLLNNPARGLDRRQLLRETGFLIHFLTQPGRKTRLSGALREALRARQDDIDAVVGADDKHPPVTLHYDSPHETSDQHQSTDHPAPRYVEEVMGRAVAGVVDRALGLFEAEDQVVIRTEDDETFYSLEEDHRLELAYYRNTMIQHFVPEGLLSTAILRFDGPLIEFDELMEETRFLSRLFKYEWIYEERAEFENVFMRTLQYFASSGWIALKRDDDGDVTQIEVQQPVVELSYLRRMVLTFLEAYGLVVRMLDELQEGRMERSEFVNRAIKQGRKGFLRGDVIFYESISKPTFINALRLLEDWQAIQREYESSAMRETTYVATTGQWPAKKYWNLQQRIDAFIYRDWELRNRIAGRRTRR